MEKKQPTPRFDSEKLTTVNCLTRLIDRKLARLVAVRDFGSSSVDPVNSLEVSSAHIERRGLVILTLVFSAICTQAPLIANRPIQTTSSAKVYTCSVNCEVYSTPQQPRQCAIVVL